MNDDATPHSATSATHSARLAAYDPEAFAWHVLRLCVALIIGAHGGFRLLHGGMGSFGTWLDSQGLPAGVVIAGAITGLEIVGSLSLAFNVAVAPLAITYIGIDAVGIAMIHAKASWFVVGAGPNGAEFSILLIVTLLTLALKDMAERSARARRLP
jgi:putative oxidoreductase